MGGDKTNEKSKEGIMREKGLFLLSSFSVVYLELEDTSGVRLAMQALKMKKATSVLFDNVILQFSPRPRSQSFTSEYVHPPVCSPLQLTDCFPVAGSQGTALEALNVTRMDKASWATILPSLPKWSQLTMPPDRFPHHEQAAQSHCTMSLKCHSEGLLHGHSLLQAFWTK